MVVFHVYEAIPDSDIPAFTYLRASVPFPAFVGPSAPFWRLSTSPLSGSDDHVRLT